ncbi:MAG: hypothetical protein ACHQ6V_04500 [Myxococcota bacterium]
MSTASSETPPCFAVGTGRSGTHFIAQLLAREPGVAAHHERAPLPDSFHRYCVWNRLAVDDAGFVANKAAGIAADRAQGKLPFEASSFLSLSIPALREAFGARFILLVRRPDRVVSSFLAKGWYADEPVRRDARLALGYQGDLLRPHHAFSRLAALGEDGERWGRLTRVGKLAYFWRRLNEAVLRDLVSLPETAKRVQALERLDYDAYAELARFIGFVPALPRGAFAELVAEKPGTRGSTGEARDWSAAEAAEFEAEVAPLAQQLGYEWRLSALRDEPRPAPSAPSLASRVRTLLGGRS